MPLHELRMSHENELDKVAAFVARRELLARDTRHLVRLAMFPVVKSGIDSGLPYLVARLEHVDTLFGTPTLRPKDMRVKLTENWTASPAWLPLGNRVEAGCRAVSERESS
jgi:hypothetical protein